VVWYRINQEPIVGREAKSNILGYCDVPGNEFITSIKRSLGKERFFSIFGTKQPAIEVAAEIFGHLKAEAQSHGIELANAVVTIPIDFDGRARRDLRKAADRAGIHIKAFVHEPFAATIGYCYSANVVQTLSEREGQIIVVFDWGGGTLDVTVAVVQGEMISELSAVGLADRSGDYFDEKLANFAKTQFLARHHIPAEELVLLPREKDRLRTESEQRKIDLSSHDEANASLVSFLRTSQQVYDLDERITRTQFEDLIHPDVDAAMALVDKAIADSGLRNSDVDLALLIGGTSRIPRVFHEMHERFGTKLMQPDNCDSIIAEGAAIIDALNLYPVLAQPIFIELSDGSHHEIFKTGEIAKPECCNRKVDLFCTDNRDGQARLIVKEGIGSNRTSFVTKRVMPIPVNPDLPRPYNHERVTAEFVIDEDLVLRCSARAATQRETAEIEVYDLHFALKSLGEE
jgi:molecular chaperone DnaK (HSP70)